MLVLSYLVTIEKSKKVISLREPEPLSMFQLEKDYLEELLIHLVIQLMVLAQLMLMVDQELKSKLQVLFQDNPCMNQ